MHLRSCRSIWHPRCLKEGLSRQRDTSGSAATAPSRSATSAADPTRPYPSTARTLGSGLLNRLVVRPPALLSALDSTRAAPPAAAGRHPAGQVEALLQVMLSRGLGTARRIRAVEHRSSSTRSSFTLEEVDVIVDEGELVRLVLKILGSPGLQASAAMAKPLFLHDPLREIELYRHVFADRPELGVPALHSTVVEPEHDRYWMLLERVAGSELSGAAEVEVWLAAARWLAGMHAELGPLVDYPSTPGITRLLRYDRDFLRMWVTRAQSIVRAQDSVLPAELRMGMNRLAGRYEGVVQRLLEMPRTVIHGEFHPANIVVRQEGGTARVCALDWEMAGIGPHLLDLAALLAGVAEDERRREIAVAYRQALPRAIRDLRSEAEFLGDLAFCRLHMAVQWLGEAPHGAPPAYRVEDWLTKVLRLAEGLDL